MQDLRCLETPALEAIMAPPTWLDAGAPLIRPHPEAAGMSGQRQLSAPNLPSPVQLGSLAERGRGATRSGGSSERRISDGVCPVQRRKAWVNAPAS